VVEVKFWKMHGLGNDFIVIDNRNKMIANADAAELALKLCERRFSVGADGLLLLSNSATADVKMQIFNADGSEAEMCGNGIRCFAKYTYENDIVRKTAIAVETLAGIKQTWLTLENNEVTSVRVDMGTPAWERSQIPMLGQGTCIDQDLQVKGERYNVTCLSVGNPHCVIFVSSVDDFPVEIVGPRIENHGLFPKKTNVEFAQVLNRNELKIRVWERGCGETSACGTGACAAVAAAKTLKKVDNGVTVHLLGGDLRVDYAERLFLDGPAEKVFEGTLFEGVKVQ
jgi:diaminopimelate epimerase